MYNLWLYYCSYFFQFLAFTRISKFLLKMLKVHQKKKMLIINFANKWEIIIIIQDKKNRDKFFVRWKNLGEKYWSGKRKSGKNFVREKLNTCKNFITFPRLFFPDKVFSCTKMIAKHLTWTFILTYRRLTLIYCLYFSIMLTIRSVILKYTLH